MEIKIYSLFSSSKGNSLYINCGGNEILIDAGVSAKTLETSLAAIGTSLGSIRAVFITHEHTDHIKGLKTISKKYGIPIYIPSRCADSLPEECRPFVIQNESGDSVEFENIRIESHTTPHDSSDCLCFRMRLGDKTFGYATDVGHLSHEVQDTVFGCDSVFIESNHDLAMLRNGSYPYRLKERILSKYGHLSNAECARFLPYLVKGGTKFITLGHLSGENNLPELAYSVSKEKLNEFNITVNDDRFASDVSLNVASPSEPVRVYI